MTPRFDSWVELRAAYNAAVLTMALLGVMSIVIYCGAAPRMQPFLKVFGIIYYAFSFAFSLLTLYSSVVGR